jgi:hypothetical protein
MLIHKGLLDGLEGWQHFIGQDTGFRAGELHWHKGQGVRATRTPNIKTNRFIVKNNFFIIESYDLLPVISNGCHLE